MASLSICLSRQMLFNPSFMELRVAYLVLFSFGLF